MEHAVNPKSSVVLKSESSLDSMERNSQGLDDKGDPSDDDISEAIKPPSQEFRKTQGFRRTTITEHEGTGDVEIESLDWQPQQQQQSLSVCQSGRQPKHTERAEEFLTTVRKRGGKKDSSEPASCSATDVETASEGSVESTPETKTGQKSDSKNVTGQPAAVTKGTKDDDEDEDDDTSKSDGDGLTSKERENHLRRKREQEPSELTLKGIQDCPRKKHREEDPTETVDVEAGNTVETEVPSEQQPETVDRVAVPQESKEDQDSKLEAKAPQGITDEEPEELVKWKPECDVCDPDALYCISQQPHDNRFMICCDLLEEWFPGDCEGISEACGELWEGNGEDCICPDFTILQAQDETTSESDQQETKFRHENADGTELPSIGTIEQKSSEDQGIKGRIEKATNSNGKRKLKIFHPVIETPGATKCIGPGCSSVAQPDSVYCSDDCILKHAAATMKFLSAGKEPKPKVQGKPKLKPEECSPPKSGVQAGIKISSVQKRPAPDKEENIAKKTMVMTPQNEGLVKETTSESSISSWVLDHNYSAVKPEETAAISSSLSYKSMKEEKRMEDKMTTPLPVTKKVIPSTSASVTGKQTSTLPRNIVPKKSPSFTNASVTKKATKKSPGDFKGVIPKKSWLSGSLTGSVSSTKQSVSVSASTASTSKKLHVSSTLAGGPRKPLPPSTSPASSSTPGKSGTTSSQSQPNSQIRQNIRRSLKEILWKRVNDSDDLIMTENEVGKIALRIEKEMFNLFQVTDNRYKGTYRSIMLNLKDPKNQGLFHRVLREEISLAKLVRMKPEELASKELSMWKEKPTTFMIESKNKLQTGSKKSATKQEAGPNMDNYPPVSDSDEQELARAVPEKSGAPLLDVFSSILQDTTSQHRAHLFDLNCKICTGQVPSSEDEPAPKKPKLSASVKKVKSKSKSDSSGSGSVSRPADDLVSEAIAESTSEPEVESIPQMNLERSYFLIPLEYDNAEPSSVEESSLYPNSCSAGVVTTAMISGRDPRTARRSSAATSTSATRPSSGLQTNKLWTGETKRETLKPVLTPTVVPESVSTSFVRDPRYLPVPPSPNINIPGMRYPQERDTSLCLSHLGTIWKGFVNMQSVGKFVAKAYPVSGCFEYLSEELPDTMHVGGRILPRAVWDYVGKVKSSVSKELCLIRFHPATEEEEVAYISLYSYFSSRGYFGVVANNNRHIRDLYLIPLGAQDPIPSKLLPFEGPGLESPRTNLILGLVVRQNIKRPSNAGELGKMEEKRRRLQTREEIEVSVYPKGVTSSQSEKKQSKYQIYSADTGVSTTPPGSLPPPPAPLPDPPASSSVLKILPSLKTETTTATSLSASSATVTTTTSSPGNSSSSKTVSPLEHILQTLFGKKKSFDLAAKDSELTSTLNQESKVTVDEGVPATPLLDPIVQQFGKMSKDETLEEEEDDRPYDPEEEYDPEKAFETQITESEKRYDLEKRSEISEREDVAYDPEDETILEEAKVAIDDLPNKMCTDGKNSTEETSEYVTDISAPSSLVEQQKIIEELKKQIEERKRQLEEQEEALRQQRAAVGVSMAHFSVSDALMSPPPKSSLIKTKLFQPEQQTADKSDLSPTSNQLSHAGSQSSGLRQSRDPRQARRMIMGKNESENSLKPLSSSSRSRTPMRELPAAVNMGQLPTPPREEKELNPATQLVYSNDKWVPSEKATVILDQDGQNDKSENSENTSKPHLESAHPSVPEVSSKPLPKILLPTPPNTSFQPNFPVQNDGQTFSSPSGASSPFSNTVFTSQEKSLSSSQYEDRRNPQFAEKNDSSAAQDEGERGSQSKRDDNRGMLSFPSSGEKGGPLQSQFQGQNEPTSRNYGAASGPHGPSFPGPRGPTPQFSEENNSSSEGQGAPSSTRFGGQKAPIPLLFSGQHRPPPFGDNRGPSPYFGGPRGVAPSQFEDRRDPHWKKREFQDAQYSETTNPPSQFEGPQQSQFMGNRGPAPFPFGGQRRPLLCQFKEPQGGPPPTQFGGPGGPPPGHFVGPRGPPPNQSEGPWGSHPNQFEGPWGPHTNPLEGPWGPHPNQSEGLWGPYPNQSEGPWGSHPNQFEGPWGPHTNPLEGPWGPHPNQSEGLWGPHPNECEGLWGPPPNQFEGPWGSHPNQFEGPWGPHTNQLEGPWGPHPDQLEGLWGPHPDQFEELWGPPPDQFEGLWGPHPNQFEGLWDPHPNQFEELWGPPPDQFEGLWGPHPNQFEGPQGPAGNFMPGPRVIQPQQFEEQRVNSPPRFANQRGPTPLQFGPRGSAPFSEKNKQPPSRFHFQGQSLQHMKPPPRLELPSHPPQHGKERWEEARPFASLPTNISGQASESDSQCPATDFRDGKSHECRNQNFEGSTEEKSSDEPETQLSENRQGRGFEDRRRDQDHGKPWERERDQNWSRDTERDCDRNKEKNQNTDKDKESECNKEWDINREGSRNGDRDRERDQDRRQDGDRSRSGDSDQDQTRERDRERDGD